MFYSRKGPSINFLGPGKRRFPGGSPAGYPARKVYVYVVFFPLIYVIVLGQMVVTAFVWQLCAMHALTSQRCKRPDLLQSPGIGTDGVRYSQEFVFPSLRRSSGVLLGVNSCSNSSDCANKSLGLPREQKIAVNKFWVQESEIGEECRQFWT